ncbi:MAG: hypothetical protein U0892_13760 [Pirellulales bacterium]
MPPTGVSQTPSRTWIDQETTTNKKWTGVFVFGSLIVIGIAILVYLLTRSSPRTYAFGFAVTNYKKGIPRPAYADWDWTKVKSRAADEGLDPWITPNDKVVPVNNVIELDNIVFDQFKLLDQEQLSARDTVIIYVRGQAVVQGQGDQQSVVLLAGEAAGGTGDSQAKGLEFTRLFKRLLELDVANVIVLADVCDLTHSLPLKLTRNPVPSAIGKACADAHRTGGPNLWVITSSADYQPPHNSITRGQTLLQSAVEHALYIPESTSTRLTLTAFYDKILSYAAVQTDAEQTPLLFSSEVEGNPFILGTTQQAWRKADHVFIASIRDISKFEDKLKRLKKGKAAGEPSDAQEEKSKTGSQPEKTAMHRSLPRADKRRLPSEFSSGTSPASMPSLAGLSLRSVAYPAATLAAGNMQPPAATSGEGNADSTASGASTPSSNTPAAATGAKQPPPTAAAPDASAKSAEGSEGKNDAGSSDPRVMMRRRVEQLQLRGENPWSWSPVDFAPLQWKKTLWEVGAASPPDTDAGNAKALLRELDDLIARIKQRSPATGVADTFSDNRTSLPKRWDAFLRETVGRRSAWDNSKVLPDDEARRWEEIRRKYATYADAVFALDYWMEWCLASGRNSAAPNDEILAYKDAVSQVQALIQALAEVRRKIPVREDTSILDADVEERFDVAPIEAALGTLRDSLNRQVETLARKMRPTETKGLTWSDERVLAGLMASPLLTAEQYSRLSDGVNRVLQLDDAKKALYQLETDELDKQEDHRDDRVSQQIQNGQKKWSEEPFKQWERLLATAVALTDGSMLDPQADAKEPFGASYVKRLSGFFGEVEKKFSGLCSAQWHAACLMPAFGGARRLRPCEAPAGLVLSVSDSKALYVKSASSAASEGVRFDGDTLGTSTEFEVIRGDGSDIERCKVRWLLNEQDKTLLTNLGYVPTDVLQLKYGTQNLSDRAQDVPVTKRLIRIQFVQDPSVLQKEAATNQTLPTSVRVTLEFSTAESNPVRRELTVRLPRSNRVGVSVVRAAVNPSRGISSDGKLQILDTPCIESASSGYRFQMVNLSGKAKLMRGSLYAVDALPDDPKWTYEQCVKWAEEKITAARRQPLLLIDDVKFSAADQESQPIVFKPAGPPGPPDQPVQTALQKMDGLLFILEEWDEVKKQRVKLHYGLFRVRTKRPVPDWVKITSTPTEQNNRFRLTLKAEPYLWSEFGAEAVPIEIAVTDGNGKTVVDAEGAAVTRFGKLTPDAPEYESSIIVPAQIREKLFAHLSIGKFPRAVVFSMFESRAESYEQPFVWIGRDNDPGIECEADIDGKLQIVRPIHIQDDGGLLFPAYTAERNRIIYKRIRAATRLDGGPTVRPKVVVESDSETENGSVETRDNLPDRTFKFQLRVVGGVELKLFATAADAPMEFDYQAQKQMTVTASAGEASESRTLVFDTTKPREGRIIVANKEMGRDLYAGESILVTLKLQPADAREVDKVFFSIDKPGGKDNEFDEGDIEIKGEVTGVNGEWQMKIDSALFANLNETGWNIVARAVDRARNIQDVHKTDKVIWRGKRAEPAKSEKAAAPQ